jgi:CO/xanthine dehydrogenase Mo-binding subunit
MKREQPDQDLGLPRLADFHKPDLVYVGTVRSPSARGSIRSISSPHLPRDYRFITAEDIPGDHFLRLEGESVPILAKGRVSYKGEAVGLIAGPDRRRVLEAIKMTRVDIEPETPEYGYERFESSQIVAREKLERGDLKAAMEQAHKILKAEFKLGPLDHYYPEPQGAASYYDYDKLVIITSTQWPFHVRDSVAKALAVKPEELVVKPSYLGPHLDGKLWYPSLLACHASLCARILGRPSLLCLSRNEDFLYTTKRAPFFGAYRAAIGDDGRLLALEASISLNLGAYGPLAGPIARKILEALPGPYACPAIACKVWAVRTNLTPMGSYAGLGGSSAQFAIERIADLCAAEAGQDPVAWRAANAAQRGDGSAGAPAKQGARITELNELLLGMSDYKRKRSAYELIRKRRPDPEAVPGFGIGLAWAYQSNDGTRLLKAAGPTSVEVSLGKDSVLSIRSSVLPMDEGALQLWRNEAASTLDIDPSLVRIQPVSTDTVPDSGAAAFSSGISVVTKLIAEACEGIRSKRFREALPITVRKSTRSTRRIASPLDGASFGGAAVELAIDPLDGSPLVRGIWMSVNAGRILSRSRAEHSLKRDIARALSNCMSERFYPAREDYAGSPLFCYAPLRVQDIPPIELRFCEAGADASPGGLGELAFIAVPAAFASALSQAKDEALLELPLDRRVRGEKPR